MTLLVEQLDPAAVWLFGSEASGRATPHSDVDLALLCAAPTEPLRLLDVRGALAEQLGRDVDLVGMRRVHRPVEEALARRFLDG